MAASRRASLPYLVTFHAGGHSSRVRNSVRGLQWRVLRPLIRQAERDRRFPIRGGPLQPHPGPASRSIYRNPERLRPAVA
jgi:hypothetical protein